MIGRSSNFLGMAIAEDAITCAEVSIAGTRRTVRRTTTFALSPELSLEHPTTLGQALATSLRQQRFTASRVIVGLPARYLLAVDKPIPPATDAEAAAALRLAAERISASENGELIFDYAGEANSSAPNHVLLVAAPRQRVGRIEQVLDAAGMSIVGITSTALAIAACAPDLDPDAAILLLNKTSAEILLRDQGAPRMLRHVATTMNGHGTPAVAPLGAELKRTVALQSAPASAAQRELYLLNSIDLRPDQISDLSARSGIKLRSTDATNLLRLTAAADNDRSNQYLGAAALALSGASSQRLPVNFTHSRLAPPRTRRIGRPALWGIILAAAVIIAIVSLYISLNQRQNDLAALSAKIDEMKTNVTDAQSTVDHVGYARGFFENRPDLLECLRQITLAFHDEERIWVVTFGLKDTGKGTLTGRAADRPTVLTLIQRLQKNPRFTDVKLSGDIREADARSREVSFTVTFDYNFVE